LSVAGSTTIFCTVTDTWTGVKSVTANCVITWPVQTIPITAVTWSIGGATNSAYTASAQSVTVVSVSPPGATYSTSTTTATDAGSVASTTITGTGTYTGSFTSPNLTIIAATISGTAASPPSASYNAGSQSGTVITGVSPVGATFSGSVTASGTNAGTYTSSITGTGNYTGTVNGGTFTISATQLTISAFDQFDCDGNENGYYNVSISGIQGSDSVTLEVWIGDFYVGPQSVAPVLPFAIGFYNGVTDPGPNPRNITNANLSGGVYNGLVLKKNDGDTGGSGTTFYWIILYGNANYLSSLYFGPRGNYCGG
jgi:hypothetical protein